MPLMKSLLQRTAGALMSAERLFRNTRTIGLDLEQWVKKGRLVIQTVRPFYHGLEMHLARTIKAVTEFDPHVVIIDPISGQVSQSGHLEEIELSSGDHPHRLA